MNIAWEYVETFLAVAEEKSFSSAARQLSVTQPTISRRISAMEEKLGRSLFTRNVEGAVLTEEGAKLLSGARQMARFAKELGEIATDFDDHPRGVVRISAPAGTAFEFLVPLALDLRKRLPDIQLHAVSGIEDGDLSRGRADLAIRSRPPTASGLAILAHGRAELGVYASEKYASSSQCIRPQDIDWITWASPQEHLEPGPTLRKLIPGFQPVFASSDYNVQTRAVTEGLGAMVLPKVKSENLPFGSLVELDVGLSLPAADLYLVCAESMRWAPRVRAVARELVRALHAYDGVNVMESHVEDKA